MSHEASDARTDRRKVSPSYNQSMERFGFEEFVRYFHETARESPWILWIGSAVSCPAPSLQPSAYPLVQALCSYLADDEEDRLLTRALEDFTGGGTLDLTASSMIGSPVAWRMPFEAVMGEIANHTGKLVQSLLEEAFPRKVACRPNSNHVAITELVGAGLVDLVVTTNFDECLDGIWTGPVMIPVDDFRLPATSPTLVKVHGTMSDYATVAVNPDALAKRSRLSWRDSLVNLLRGRRVLLVGYGFQDRFDLTPALIQAERDGAEFVWADKSFPPTLPLTSMCVVEHNLDEPGRNVLDALAPAASLEPGTWPSPDQQRAAVASMLRSLDKPTTAERLKAFAAIYFWLEDGKNSLRLYCAARASDPTSVDTHTLARACLRARRYRRAVSLFRQMLHDELPTNQDLRFAATVDWHCGAAHCAAAGGRVLTARRHYEQASEALSVANKVPTDLEPYLMDQLLRGRAGNSIRLAVQSWSLPVRDMFLLAAEADLELLATQTDRLELRVRYLIKRDIARIQLIRGDSSTAVEGLTEVKDFFTYWGDPDGLTVAMRDLAVADKVSRFRSLAPAAAAARSRGRWLEWMKIEATRLGLSGYGPLAPAQTRIRNATIATWDTVKELVLTGLERGLRHGPERLLH